VTLHVNVDDFARAETDRMFRDLQAQAGGVNRFVHNREPAAIDNQTVIRLNRDTLYSFAVADLAAGATLTLPEHGDRYLSAMVVNQDHYVDAIFHDAGSYELTSDTFGTRYVTVAVRTLVDPADPSDPAAVAAIQDAITLTAASSVEFAYPDYDVASLDETREALLVLARNLTAFDRTFGSKDEVDPVRHLIGTAAGWGGLPDAEATYVAATPGLPVGEYELVVPGDVPVDGFWSISVYNAEGFFEPNERDAYSVNNITAAPNADGSVTVRFGGDGDPARNSLPITEGWNYLVRLYRPRPEILKGDWTFPALAQ